MCSGNCHLSKRRVCPFAGRYGSQVETVFINLAMSFRAANIHQSFRVMELFLKLVGSLPIHWRTRKSASRLNRTQRVTNSTFLALNYIFTTVLIYFYAQSFYEYNNTVLMLITVLFCQAFTYILPILAITTGHATAESMKQILCDLHSIDYKVR